MRRLALTALLGASLALGPVAAAPARADNQDVARIVAGLALLGIVGAAINNRDKDDDGKDRRKRVIRDRHPIYRGHDGRGFGHRDRFGDHHRRGGARTLPAACLSRVQGYRGPVDVFGTGCLQRSMRRTDLLPGRCATRVHAYGRMRPVYDARCLRDNGWTVARRR